MSTRYGQALKFNLNTFPTAKLLESPNNGSHFYFMTSFGIRLIVTIAHVINNDICINL